MSETRQQIAEGVTLVTTSESETQIKIQIENKIIKIVKISINLSGSHGVKISQCSGLQRTVQVPPRRTEVLVTLQLQDSYQLQTQFECQIKKVTPDMAKQLTQKNTQKIQKKIHAARQHFRRLNINTQDISHVRHEVGHYLDPTFVPDDNAVSCGSDMTMKLPVQWRRPRRIFKGQQYDIFQDKIEPNDIKQGKLGDCWFMCALASLAERPSLVERLFINKTTNEDGLYQVWFCKGGEWVRVTVDDHFPCFPKQGPVFSRSQGSQLWVLILEKAYAKLHGSYGLLRGGWASEGMMDLTGCPTLTYNFEQEETKKKIEQDTLWSTLVYFDQKGALISASTPGEDRWTEVGGPKHAGGLVPGHAYTVIEASQAQGNRLLNIRNPWGHFEWEGDWGDNSPLWTQEMKSQVKPVLQENDGTFWMSYNDFIKNFSGVNICRVDSYEFKSVRGKFQRKVFEGQEWVVPKWYYMIQAEEDSTVIIGLHQEDERVLGVESRRSYLDLGIVVLDASGGFFKLYKAQEGDKQRQIELEVQIQAGKLYVVWPRTSGCAISRPKIKVESIEWFTEGEMHPLVESSLKDLFKKSNVMIGEELSYPEFAHLMKIANVDYSEAQFGQLLDQLPSHEGGLTVQGFLEFFRDQFTQLGVRKVKSWFTQWGYDQDLFSIQSRTYTVTFHSDHKLKCYMKKNRGLMMTDMINIMLLQQLSDRKLAVNGVNLHCLHEKSANAFTYGVYNGNTFPVKVVLDCSKSQGLIFSSQKAVNEVVVENDSWKSICHAQIAKEATSCKLKPSIKVRKMAGQLNRN